MPAAADHFTARHAIKCGMPPLEYAAVADDAVRLRARTISGALAYCEHEICSFEVSARQLRRRVEALAMPRRYFTLAAATATHAAFGAFR